MERIIIGSISCALMASGAIAGTLINPNKAEIQEPKFQNVQKPEPPKGLFWILAIQAATAAKGG